MKRKQRKKKSKKRIIPSAKVWSNLADELLLEEVIRLVDIYSVALGIGDWILECAFDEKLVDDPEEIACGIRVGSSSAEIDINPAIYKIMLSREWTLDQAISHELAHAVMDPSKKYLQESLNDSTVKGMIKKSKIAKFLEAREESIANIISTIVTRRIRNEQRR